MKINGWICVATFVLIVSFVAAPAFGQENVAAKTEASAASAVAEVETTVQSKDLTLYGEVQATDPAANTLSVQYYNYDTDEEKTMEITFNKNTLIENVAGLADIKKGDWVDVTYITSGAKNIAGLVIVEKEEAITEESARPLETFEPSVEE